MGMFSWCCHGCGYSLRHSAGWMADAVVIKPRMVVVGQFDGYNDERTSPMPGKGEAVIGYYDGYGRIFSDDEEHDISPEDYDKGPEPCVYHQACWNLLGQPLKVKPSLHARDQGHFYDGSKSPKEPKNLKDLTFLKRQSERERLAEEKKMKKLEEQWAKERLAKAKKELKSKN